MVVAVDPLVRAAAKAPRLGPQDRGNAGPWAEDAGRRPAALAQVPQARRSAGRAAALAGLCTVLPVEMGGEVTAGLQDPSDKVRITAAQVCFQSMEAQRSGRVPATAAGTGRDGDVRGNRRTCAGFANFLFPRRPCGFLHKRRAKSRPPVESKPPAESKPAAETKVVEEDPYDLWLKEYYAGKRRPKWATDMIAPLEKMLQAKNVDERLTAAIALVPLGKAQAVLPLLVEAARIRSQEVSAR